MEKEYLENALQALRKLRENGPECVSVGICANTYGVVGRLVRELSPSWKKYSGNDRYPVPAVMYSTPYQEYVLTKNLWDKSTEYGRLRWELLDHLIAMAEREL